MAGNKFRTFRKKEEKKEELEKDVNVILKKDYEILTKPKEEKKYYSKQILKEGTIIKTCDIIKNEDNIYVKIVIKKNDKVVFGYIASSDKNGNYNIEKYQATEKKEEKNNNSKIEKYGTIKLSDAKIENEQKSQEDLNCLKNKDELMNKMISFMGPDTSEINDESQESTDVSNNLSQIYEKEKENDNNKGKKVNQFDIKNKEKLKEKEAKINDSKNNLQSKEKEENNKASPNKSNFIERFISMSNNFYRSRRDKSSFEMNSLKKKFLVYCYILKRELDKLHIIKNLEKTIKNEENNLTLEPKYKKGIQVIFRPIKKESIQWPFDCAFKSKIGHILVRYYDENTGDDVIIESSSENDKINNEININNFKKEDFKTYVVIQEEELLGNENYLEKVKDYLYKKYYKDGKLIRGKYSVRYNCCFHAAEEIMLLFGKSDEKIRELYDKIIKIIAPVIDIGHKCHNYYINLKELQIKYKF